MGNKKLKGKVRKNKKTEKVSEWNGFSINLWFQPVTVCHF